jgi:FkbM family methyltransferase
MTTPSASVRARRPTLLESCFSKALRMLPLKHGAHRILDRVRPSPWVKGSSVVDVPYRRHVIRMDVSDLVGWHFMMLRNFDPEVTEVLTRFASGGQGDVFWDVGANKGACSFAMATALPHAKIVAVEPQHAMQALLRRNLAAVAPGRYEVCPVAIGESAGSMEIYIPDANQGAATLVPSRRGQGGGVEVIRIATAPSLQERSAFGWPTLVKIDVEGSEAAVVRSMAPAFVMGRVRCCVFECHPSEAAAFEQIRSDTEPYGYRIHAIRKTPFSTSLVPASRLHKDCTDYAIVRHGAG